MKASEFSTLRRALQCHKNARLARVSREICDGPHWVESAEFWEKQTGYWKRETWSDRGGEPALNFDGPSTGKVMV